MKVARRKHLHLHSKHRSVGDTGDLIFHLESAHTRVEDGETMRIAVAQVIIQRDWYNVTNRNNKLTIAGIPIELPPAHYSISEVITYLATALPAFIFEYNKQTNSVSCSSIASFELDFSLDDSIHEILGFEKAVFTGASTYTGTQGVYIQNTMAVRIHSNVPTSSYQSNPNALVYSNVLAVVPCNARPSDLIVFTDSLNHQFTHLPALNELHIWLTDELGFPIQPKGEWMLTLELEYMRDDESKILEAQQKLADLQKLQVLQLQDYSRAGGQKWRRFFSYN